MQLCGLRLVGSFMDLMLLVRVQSKRTASTSGFGSTASGGRSSGDSNGSTANTRGRFLGRFRRPGQSQFRRQQFGQARSSGKSSGKSRDSGYGTGTRSGSGRAFGGSSYQYGQQQPAGCFRCGAYDHLVRELSPSFPDEDTFISTGWRAVVCRSF